jgi:hypothetical protein
VQPDDALADWWAAVCFQSGKPLAQGASHRRTLLVPEVSGETDSRAHGESASETSYCFTRTSKSLSSWDDTAAMEGVGHERRVARAVLGDADDDQPPGRDLIG